MVRLLSEYIHTQPGLDESVFLINNLRVKLFISILLGIEQGGIFIFIQSKHNIMYGLVTPDAS